MLEPTSSTGLGLEEGSRATKGTTVGTDVGPEKGSTGWLVESEESRGLLQL